MFFIERTKIAFLWRETKKAATNLTFATAFYLLIDKFSNLLIELRVL